MESRRSGPIERLKQPEYTGENRCIPCTVVNVVIAVVVALAVAIVHPLAGALVGFVSVAAIYLRGYLVPGTPTLTKRYFPDWLLAKFDKAPEPGSGVAIEAEPEGTNEETAVGDGTGDERGGPDPEDVDPERALVEAGLITPCADVDDLCLTEDVRERFRTIASELYEGDRDVQLADLFDTDPDGVEVVRSEEKQLVRVSTDGGAIARWESEAALVADLAGSDLLADAIADWETYPLATRSQLASGLRAFVEHCPACDGPISIDGETVESCCRSYEVYAITCDDCEARILEVSQ